MESTFTSPNLDGAASPRSDASILWFLRLRWCALLAQACFLLAAGTVLGLRIPLESAIPLAILAGSNFFLEMRFRDRGSLDKGWLEAALVADALILTALLALTGGAANPFSIIYLVHIILAAVVLGERWTWIMTALSIVLYGALFAYSDGHAHGHGQAGGPAESFSAHLEGMWFAFAFTAVLLAFFVNRVLFALRERDEEATELRLRAAKTERFAALVNLAAGAAHELGTPLNTIAIAAEELERGFSLDRPSADQEADAALILQETRRCKKILEAMGEQSGDLRGEMPTSFSVEDLRGDLTPESGALGLRSDALFPSATAHRLLLPRDLLRRSLLCLIRNAVDADPSGKIRVDAEVRKGTIEFRVCDEGPGIPSSLLRRLGEPFLTTKPPGKGMGLGIFLVNVFAERLGGELRFDRHVPRGTIASLTIPLVWSGAR